MPQSPGSGHLELSLAERRAVEEEIWTRRSHVHVANRDGSQGTTLIRPGTRVVRWSSRSSTSTTGATSLCAATYPDTVTRSTGRTAPGIWRRPRSVMPSTACGRPFATICRQRAIESSVESLKHGIIRRACIASVISRGGQRKRAVLRWQSGAPDKAETWQHTQSLPHPDVVDTELDGNETVLLHLGTKRYFSLNATGSVIWRAVKAGRTRDEIVRMPVERYDVSPEKASRSVTTLLDALQEQRLASRADHHRTKRFLQWAKQPIIIAARSRRSGPSSWPAPGFTRHRGTGRDSWRPSTSRSTGTSYSRWPSGTMSLLFCTARS